MVVKITKSIVYKVLITVAIFWFADIIMHLVGVGESNYYYVLKLVNSFFLSFIWFTVLDKKSHYKKIIYSFVAGTWISFTYLITSYSGFVQWFGVQALYSAPPFIIGSLTLTPYMWWFFHALVFFIGIELAGLIKNKK